MLLLINYCNYYYYYYCYYYKYPQRYFFSVLFIDGGEGVVRYRYF